MPDEQEPNPQDPSPALVALLDQAQAELAARAQLLGGYYRSLRAAGLNEDQAFTLIQDYQGSMEP